MINQPKFQEACKAYVKQAVMRVLANGDTFDMKMEAGGLSHVGTSDIDNTKLASEMFRPFEIQTIIEEDLPPFSEWNESKPVLFIDPVDGSTEVGCGGTQFAAAVSLYDGSGTPVFTAAASPGLRPIFRKPDGSFEGFGGRVGALIFGGPQGTYLLPLWQNDTDFPCQLPRVIPRKPAESAYTNIALDPNLASICGLRKSHHKTQTNISRMPYSNIFSQMQVILGQADAATLGPATISNDPNGRGVSGPKAWDLILPIAQGVGLKYKTSEYDIAKISKQLFFESFVLKRRIFLSHEDVLEIYEKEIGNLLDNSRIDINNGY